MALQDRRVDADREWITVHGKRMLWYILIYEFDSRDFREIVGRITGEKRTAVMRASSLMQEIIDEYTKGLDTVERYKSKLEEAGLDMPSNTKLPQAIEELFSQLEQKYKLDLFDMLTHAAGNSEFEYQRLLPERQARERRQKQVSDILEGYTESVESSADKIRMLLYVEEHTNRDIASEQESSIENEHKSLLLWSSLLVQSICSKYITHGQMLSLVQDRIIEEIDISDLLDKYGDERDYEWYSEDFLGCDLSDETIIQVDDILALAEPKFKEILGFRQDHV